MFQKKGYDQTTIRDICSAADINISTFYNFYGDKFGILLEFYRQFVRERTIFLEPTPDNLVHPYQTICSYFLKITHIYDLFGRDLAREFSIHAANLAEPEEQQPYTSQSIYQIAAFLHKAISSGILPPDTDVWNTSEYLVSSLCGIMSFWLNLTDEPSMTQVAQRLLPKIFRAVTDQPMVIDLEQR